jgi:hypothetical protein
VLTTDAHTWPATMTVGPDVPTVPVHGVLELRIPIPTSKEKPAKTVKVESKSA